MAQPVGTMYVELSMDSTRYTKAQKAILAGAKQNSADINRVHKTVGTTSDAMYDAMRKNVENALFAIKKSHLSSKGEIVRAERAAADKITRINEQQFGKQVSWIDGLKKNWLAASAAMYASMRLVQSGWQLMEKAANAEQQTRAFESLANSYGTSSEKILNDLRRVSNGTIDTITMVEKAGTAMMMGIAPENVSRLMEIARATAKMTGQSVVEAFSDISLAVGRQSKMILDNLGIIVSVGKANEEYAAQLGKTSVQLSDTEKKIAFMNATLKAGDELMNRMGKQQDTTRDKLDQLTAAVENAKIEIGQGLSRALLIAYGSMQWLASGVREASWAMAKLLEIRARLEAKTSVWMSDEEREAIYRQAETWKAVAAEMKESGVNLAGEAVKNFEAAVASVKDFDLTVRSAVPSTKALENHILETSEKVAKAVKETGKELKKAEADLKSFFKEYDKAVQTNVDNALTFYFDDIDAAAKNLKEKEKLNADAFKKQEELNQHFLERIQDQTADTFYDIFSGNVNGWDDMLGRMKDLFIRYLAEMAAKAMAEPIILPIVQSFTGSMGNIGSALGLGNMGSALGLSGAGSSIGSALGIGKAVGGLTGLLNTSVGLNPFSTAGAVDAGLNSFYGASGMTYGSLLGAAGIGGLGYSMIGGAMGLPQSKYSGITSALGGAGGMALGSSFASLGAFGGPVGLALGALAGGLLGGVFGGDDAPEIKMAGKTSINLLSGQLDYGRATGSPFKGAGGQDRVPGDVVEQYNSLTAAAQALFDQSQAQIQGLIKIMPKDMGNAFEEYFKTHTFDVSGKEIGFDKNVEGRMNDYLTSITKSMEALVNDAFATIGLDSQEAIDAFIAKMTIAGQLSAQTIGTAFKTAVETSDFNLFGQSIKDSIYQNVSDGVLEALMQSQMFQSALSPIFYGLQDAMDKSFAAGDFNMGTFMHLATPYLGQVNDSISKLQPAFDWVSSSLMHVKESLNNGAAPSTGTNSGNADSGSNTIINVNVSDTVLAGDNVEGFFGDLIQKLQEKNIGTKFGDIKTISAGLN